MIWIWILLSSFLVQAGGAVEDLPELPVPQKSKKYLPPKPPVITEPPKSALVEKSTPFRLYCRAEGNPTPTISWYKDGSPLATAVVRDIVILPSGDLMFFQVLDKNEEGSTTGIYQCVATNELGTARSQNVSLQVKSLDQSFRKQPTDAIAAVGGAVTIQCQGPRGIPEPVMSWTKDSRKVVTSNRIKIKPGGNLRITHLQKSDSGLYVCVANNTVGIRRSTAAELRVQDPPHFVLRPSDIKLNDGQTTVLECKATGDPTPRIRWSKRGGKMSSRCSRLKGGRLKITNAQPEDEGQYVCSAENRVGKVSSFANITVEMKPKIVRKSSEVTSQVGTRSILECRARGNPKPTVFWRNPKGVSLFLDKTIDDSRLIVDITGDLIIDNVAFQDQGVYQCQAVSSLGTATADVQLVVKSKVSRQPPPVIDVAPWNTSAVIGSTVELHCSVRDAVVNWYKNEQLVPTGSIRFQKLSSGSLLIASIQAQDAGTYTCKASNDHGIDSWSAYLHIIGYSTNLPTSLNFNNDFPKPPGRPVLFNSSLVCISVSWALPPDSPDIDHYIISYYRIESGLFVWTKINNILEPFYQACNLETASDYVFVVRAVNQHGVGGASTVSDVMKTIVTDQTLPTTSSTWKELSSITTELLRASRLTSSGSDTGTIRLEWKSNGNCDSVDGFLVITQPVSSSKTGLITREASCSSRSYDFAGVSSKVMYEVRVRPVKNQRAGQASSILFVSLNAGLITPTAPDLAVKSSEQRVTLEWNPPRDISSSHLIGYTIRLLSRDNVIQRVVNVNSSTTEIVFENLDSTKVYDATVTYRTQMGEGVTSNVMEVAIESAGSSDILSQPGFIAALVGGFLFICIVITVTVCYCKRSRRKTKIKGKKRYDDKPYSDHFEMTPVISSNPHSAKADLLSRQIMTSERMPLALNDAKNVSQGIVSDARNLGMRADNTEGYWSAHSAPQSPGYYPQDDQLSVDRYVRPGWGEGQSSAVQQLNQHQQYLHRHQSESSGYAGSNPIEVESRYAKAYRSPLYSSVDLPPPPPTPPVGLSSPHASHRSQVSSGPHSTADRSSRSSQRIRRSIRSKRPGNAGLNLAEESRSDVTTSPLLERGEVVVDIAPAPPVPPPRNDSTYQNTCINRQPEFNNRYTSSNLQYGAGTSGVETDADKLGKLKVYHPNFNFNSRNSANVSNISMINGYGSESDTRESFCDRQSNASCYSENEFNMDSVSQVGPNRSEDYDETSRGQHKNGVNPNKYHYPHTYNHYPVEMLARESGDVAANPLLRKPSDKFHRSKNLNNDNSLANSGSSFSSFHQNTGDSGMSAGVGCSTAQSSSLKSHLSAGSSGRVATKPTQKNSASSSNDHLLPHDGARTFLNSHESPGHDLTWPNHSNVYVSLPPGGGKPSSHFLERRNPKAIQHRSPLSPIQSPDVDFSYSPDNQNSSSSGSQGSPFNTAKMIFNGEIGNKSIQSRTHDLPDVPETSTSDFCEDYTDQSQ